MLDHRVLLKGVRVITTSGDPFLGILISGCPRAPASLKLMPFGQEHGFLLDKQVHLKKNDTSSVGIICFHLTYYFKVFQIVV